MRRLTVFPEVIAELKLLTVLDLSFNLLSSLPPAIGSLLSLERLNLRNNSIATLPVEMGRLFRLRELLLENNPLSSPPPQAAQAGTEAVLAWLRERMPGGPPPPERHFISYIDPNIVIEGARKGALLLLSFLSLSLFSWLLHTFAFSPLPFISPLSFFQSGIVCAS